MFEAISSQLWKEPDHFEGLLFSIPCHRYDLWKA